MRVCVSGAMLYCFHGFILILFEKLAVNSSQPSVLISTAVTHALIFIPIEVSNMLAPHFLKHFLWREGRLHPGVLLSFLSFALSVSFSSLILSFFNVVPKHGQFSK